MTNKRNRNGSSAPNRRGKIRASVEVHGHTRGDDNKFSLHTPLSLIADALLSLRRLGYVQRFGGQSTARKVKEKSFASVQKCTFAGFCITRVFTWGRTLSIVGQPNQVLNLGLPVEIYGLRYGCWSARRRCCVSALLVGDFEVYYSTVD